MFPTLLNLRNFLIEREECTIDTLLTWVTWHCHCSVFLFIEMWQLVEPDVKEFLLNLTASLNSVDSSWHTTYSLWEAGQAGQAGKSDPEESRHLFMMTLPETANLMIPIKEPTRLDRIFNIWNVILLLVSLPLCFSPFIFDYLDSRSKEVENFIQDREMTGDQFVQFSSFACFIVGMCFIAWAFYLIS